MAVLCCGSCSSSVVDCSLWISSWSVVIDGFGASSVVSTSDVVMSCSEYLGVISISSSVLSLFCRWSYGGDGRASEFCDRWLLLLYSSCGSVSLGSFLSLFCSSSGSGSGSGLFLSASFSLFLSLLFLVTVLFILAAGVCFGSCCCGR